MNAPGRPHGRPNSLDTEKSPEPDGSGDFASFGEELG